MGNPGALADGGEYGRMPAHLRIVAFLVGLVIATLCVAATVSVVSGFSCRDHPDALICRGEDD